MLQHTFALAGTPPKPAKAFPMQWHRGFLGAVLDLQDVNPEGHGDVYVIPKASSRRQVELDIETALVEGKCRKHRQQKHGGGVGW